MPLRASAPTAHEPTPPRPDRASSTRHGNRSSAFNRRRLVTVEPSHAVESQFVIVVVEAVVDCEAW